MEMCSRFLLWYPGFLAAAQTVETEITAEMSAKRVPDGGSRIVSAVKWTVEGMVKDQVLEYSMTLAGVNG